MYCYKFPSQAAFRTLAAAAGYITTNDEGAEVLRTGGHGWALDEVGTIYEGGTYDTNGEVITPPVALSGWHVNYVGEPPEAWDEYLVVVNSAVRVFLGGTPQAPSTDVLAQMV
jgi:hypothetical protein